MASPLRFLRRLVSRGGERKQDADKVDEAKPEVLAIAGPTDTASGEGLEDASRPAGLQPSHQNPVGAVSAEKTAAVDEAGAETDDTADGDFASIRTVDGSASGREPGAAVTAAHDATEVQPAVGHSSRKQRSSKGSRPAVVVAQISDRPPTPSDETMRLDEEIKVLKGQLASRLKIQNAQLKKMLERFER